MNPAARRRSFAHAIVAVLAVSTAMAASCRSASHHPPVQEPRVPAKAPPLPAGPAGGRADGLVPPVVRVGLLTDVARAILSADSGIVVRDATGRERRLVRATFVPILTAAPRTRFVVQLASFTDEDPARDIAERARRAAVEAAVRWSPETRTYQVRVGDLRTREEAQALASRLASVGLAGGWVALEAVPAAPGRIRLLETVEDLPQATIVAARAGDPVTADGLPYRGIFEVRPGSAGLVVVNVLNVEDYLRGVVPNELSPTVFPAIEALKAQAVAARTYVLRNRGQFASQGYDICATPACQVYRGRSTEHPLSDRAVEETRGMGAFHRGSLINALYTSTCGGHTEHGSNIFEGEPTPYLVGVACAPERDTLTTIRTRAEPAVLSDEPDLGREAAVLAALGVLDPRALAGDSLHAPAGEEELRAWVSQLVTAVHRRPCGAPLDAHGLTRRGGFFRHLVASLCWEDRGRRLLAPGDAEYLLGSGEGERFLDETERLAAAVLVQEKVVAPFPDNTLRPDAAMTRGHAISILARAALAVGPPDLVSAAFLRAAGDGIVVTVGEEERAYALDPSALFFRSLGGHRVAVSQVDLAGGDMVRLIVREGRVLYLEADQSLLGRSADRSSKVYRWEVKLTPSDIATSIARYGDVGTVRDLSARRVGVSGRVIELAVLGEGGELLLRGLRVRWGLGLRENLFVVDRERDAAGQVSRFVFTGKGWGHGVGLCQVGSFGMAQSGSTFDRILRHYYSGIGLAAAY